MKKSFVLDTNVLLHNAGALGAFEDNEVVIPMDVIEELDKFKSENNELGRNARQVVRELDTLRTRGRLSEGVPMKETSGTLRVALQPGSLNGTGLSPNVPDNRIISVAYELHSNGKPVTFVSKDINARIKSDSLGIRTMDFEKQKVNFDELYTGWREVTCNADFMAKLSRPRGVPVGESGLLPNECALLTDEANPKHTRLGRCTADGKNLVALQYDNLQPMKISPRNMEQHFAFELLLDPDVQLVTLVGQAGTGKTLLALAAALVQVTENPQYEKVLVSRPVIPLGKDIGYLPGSMEDKLGHWMLPIYDNLAYLISLKGGRGEVGKKVETFLSSGVIVLEALTYIRGRSIADQYLIVDEAQNLTPHEVKTIISRAGEGTKIVMTGDPYQIDNPYLDASSNGLTYAVERLKGREICGHVTLAQSERSALSSLAAELL